MLRHASAPAALCLLLIVALPGCDDPATPSDGGGTGTDGGGAGTDAGGAGTDAGGTGTDAGGTGTDGGGGGDDGSTGSDAGCSVASCPIDGCGVLDDGCGGTINCGACDDGAACDADEDCSGGICFTEEVDAFPGGHCTGRCSADTDCEVTSHCARIDPVTLLGYCRVDCLDDDDCRPEYTCIDADEAPIFVPDGELECTATASGTGVVGAPCSSFADCAGGDAGRCIVAANGFADGYCTVLCNSSPDDCPGMSHCSVTDPDTGDGVCVADCDSDADCRGGSAGYLCFDGDEAGTDECYPAGTGSTAVGGPCEGIWDCDGGRDARCLTTAFLDGYCTEVGCAVDLDCPSGSHCGTHSIGGEDVNVCSADCVVGTTTCRDGQLCWDNNEDDQDECWVAGTGTAAVGDPCNARYECAGGERAFCVTGTAGYWADGYCALADCTIGGTGSEACPTDSHCRVTTGPRGVCVASCTDSSECRMDGYDCYDDADMGSEMECMPAATGPGAVGDPCTELTDCDGGRYGFCQLNSFYRGGYCFIECADTTCPGGSLCTNDVLTSGGSPLDVCVDSCTASSDCREPIYSCRDTALAGSPDSCLPAP